MSIYKGLTERYTEDYKQLSKRRNLLSLLRTLTFFILLGIICLYVEDSSKLLLFTLVGGCLFFFYLLWLDKKNRYQRKVTKTFIRINAEERAFLSGKEKPFSSGERYADKEHLYASDLNIFGEGSLYEYINRTRTYRGGKILADQLLEKLESEEILRHQEAIKELNLKIHWRQRLQVLGILTVDSKEKYDALIQWASKEDKRIPLVITVFSYLLPFILLLSLFAFILLGDSFLLHISVGVFLVNLILLSTQLRKIVQQSLSFDKVYDILKAYSAIIEHIEKENFTSSKLRELQVDLQKEQGTASSIIKKLAVLFSNAESLNNVIAAAFFNGCLLFHIHNFNKIKFWKKNNAEYIVRWLDIIGQFEMLSSLGNFAYNNPRFCYPLIDETQAIFFSELGHPLIREEDRVCNTIDLKKGELIILTGANMSGKSTFLRALGINMVLAGIGSPVCAQKAILCPIKPLVSMSQQDSLVAGESYFFAEIKRLKRIVDALKQEKCLVLLDEILRGTNSEDKRLGTDKIIRKLINLNAIGMLATHDLKICNIADEYPQSVFNKCFEVAVVEEEFVSNYKLREGVCQSKNATFLMEKMGII